MKRYVIITVGKTHSGKTTFATELEKQIPNSVVIDQDNHAEILHTYYERLVPKEGPNTIKYALTKTIVDFTVNETDSHIILCNSNRNSIGRLRLLEQFHNKGFNSILVSFQLSDDVLKARIMKSHRDKTILRTAVSFEEVLLRQQEETNTGDVKEPVEGEANHLFVVHNEEEVPVIIQEIVKICH